MQEIRPQTSSESISCEETPAQPCAMVVFGASGDLTSRKLIPSLFEVDRRGLLSKQFYLLGVGRKKLSDEKFRQIAQQAIKQSFNGVAANQIRSFIDKLYYTSGDYSSDSFYKSIKERVAELNTKHKTGDNLIVIQSSDFFGLMLDNGIFQGNLAVTCHHHLILVSDGQNRSAMNFRLIAVHAKILVFLLPRMGLIICLHQSVDTDMGIFLGRRQTLMS